MRSRLIPTITALLSFALSSGAQAEGLSKTSDALYRPVALIVGVTGAAGSLAFIPFSFTDGAVRSITRSTREDRSVLQGAGDFFVEGARGFTRSFNQAAWCPLEYMVSSPLGNTDPCRDIAWSEQGVYAQ